MSKLWIVSGSIQGTVFGYNLDLKTLELEKCYTIKDHAGKLKDIHLTSNGKLMTCAEDEII